jgi:hypothetical protein
MDENEQSEDQNLLKDLLNIFNSLKDGEGVSVNLEKQQEV